MTTGQGKGEEVFLKKQHWPCCLTPQHNHKDGHNSAKCLKIDSLIFLGPPLKSLHFAQLSEFPSQSSGYDSMLPMQRGHRN